MFSLKNLRASYCCLSATITSHTGSQSLRTGSGSASPAGPCLTGEHILAVLVAVQLAHHAVVRLALLRHHLAHRGRRLFADRIVRLLAHSGRRLLLRRLRCLLLLLGLLAAAGVGGGRGASGRGLSRCGGRMARGERRAPRLSPPTHETRVWVEAGESSPRDRVVWTTRGERRRKGSAPLAWGRRTLATAPHWWVTEAADMLRAR